MPRIVYRGNGYERVPSQSWLERNFEDLVLDRSPQIFPRWRTVRFIADVSSPDGATRRPDLALIDLHYRSWWVVEVELQHHSLNGHVLPQVEVFAQGRYGTQHAEWVAARNPDLDPTRLREMMQGEPPGVLVVVDSPGTGWERDLDDCGARLGIVEPFRDANGDFMLRVNGFQPEPPGEILTRCSRGVGQVRMWSVSSPAALPVPDAEGWLTIEYAGEAARWRRIQLADSVLLHAERGNPILDLSAVDLIVRSDLSLEFVPATTIRRRSR